MHGLRENGKGCTSCILLNGLNVLARSIALMMGVLTASKSKNCACKGQGETEETGETGEAGETGGCFQKNM